MSVEEYAALPDVLEVRELRYKISHSGFRTRDVTRVKTLLDAEVYTAAQLTCLRGARWGVKADLKHLKQTIKMDVLKCKRVEGVLKELRCTRCSTTMVRLVMAEAARRQEVAADRIRFFRRATLAARLEGGRRVGPTESEPGPFRSSGTACPQAAAKGIYRDEKAEL